jgi:peroxiredoxin
MTRRLLRVHTTLAPLLLAVTAGLAYAADSPPVRAALRPQNERKPAPEFALRDAAGKKLSLRKYRGKVVLLDFWATWCHGCKEEIPWFSQFQRQFVKKGLRVVGVSMDDDGWKSVKPFLAATNIPYSIVIGDDVMAKMYSIETMPDAFLIDRHGRIAAVYVGLVDKDNVETNIRTMLAQR